MNGLIDLYVRANDKTRDGAATRSCTAGTRPGVPVRERLITVPRGNRDLLARLLIAPFGPVVRTAVCQTDVEYSTFLRRKRLDRLRRLTRVPPARILTLTPESTSVYGARRLAIRYGEQVFELLR